MMNNKAQEKFNEGNDLLKCGQIKPAIDCYNESIILEPDYADAYNWRGNAQQMLGQLDAAISDYKKAIAIKPDHYRPYHNQGMALHKLGKLDESASSYSTALTLKPDNVDSYYGRGLVYEDLQQLDAAIADYEKAIKIKPDFEYLFGKLLHDRMKLCDWNNFDGNVSELIRRINNNEKCSTGLSVLALTSSLSVQRKTAEILINDKYPYNPYLGPITKQQKSGKIRIGYYSADFYNHATAYLMAELFELHDRNKFELFAFSYGPDRKDEMQQRISKAFDRFIDVRMKNDIEIAALSRNMGIDIAVDLKGFTTNQRMGIFSYRAAPIQVNYIGYPGTSGADYIDYLIADAITVPEEYQHYYSEKIVRLPNSYQVNDRKRKISEDIFTREYLGLPDKGVVFCCFNRNYKILPSTFDSWVKILSAVKGSVLWLLEEHPQSAINLRKEAEARGLDPKRLVFAKRMDLPEHLARHGAADLFLDTLPYNAHTTASDALWTGLPVLTCMEESFASRVAASLLHSIGMPELITKTHEEYEALAIDLGNNLEKLENIKESLAANRQTAPLFNTNLYARHIESAYIKMHERYRSGLQPEHIHIN